jgi:diguanylate cyclase (GGDEF)-like protein
MKKRPGATGKGPAKVRRGGVAGRKATASAAVRPADRAKHLAKELAKELVKDRTAATILRRLRTELATARKHIAELQASANTDFLLDIPNRRGFERELDRAVAYIKRYQASAALIVLDVDRLKPINDAFGHAAGDEVLKSIAATLTRQVRASDMVGRLGGDEFGVLLWNLSETDMRVKAAALEQAIDGLSFVFGGQRVTAGASAGVAILGPHAQASRALEEADRAMYVRKALRRHET